MPLYQPKTWTNDQAPDLDDTNVQYIDDGIAGLYNVLFDNANEFSTSVNYNVGDYVIKDLKLYRFNVDHTAGEWDATQVTQRHIFE